MTILTVGLNKQYSTIPLAIKAANLVGGDTILVDAGLKFNALTAPIIIDRPLSLIADSSNWNNLTSIGMQLFPSINHAEQNLLASEGVSVDAWKAILATLPYLQSTADIPLPSGGTETIVVRWFANMDKGVITVTGKTDNVHIEGFELFNGKISSTYNGAGIRGQGKNLSVSKCKIHDCQDGILANAQYKIDPSGLWKIVSGQPYGNYTLQGFVSVTDCEFWNNGNSDGITHDIYLGPCLVAVTARNTHHNCLGGHHSKFDGALFQICLDQNGVDDDASLTSQTCDGTSGLAFYVNSISRKVNPAILNVSNTGEMVLMRNNRMSAPFGNRLIALNNRLESTVHKAGNFFTAINFSTYKDDPTGSLGYGTPSPITWIVDGNVCTATDYMQINSKGVTVNDPYDYLTQPFSLPASGGTLGNNYVGKIGASDIPTVQKIDFGRTLFRASSELLNDLTTFIKTVDPVSGTLTALNYCVTQLQTSYPTIFGEDPQMIAELQAQLALDEQKITDLQTQLTTIQGVLTSVSTSLSGAQTELQTDANEIDQLNTEITALQTKISNAKTALQ